MSADYYLEGAKSPYEIRFHNVGNLAPGILHTGYVDVPQPEGIQEDLKGPEKRIRLFTRAKECDWSSSGSGTSPASAHTTPSLARRIVEGIHYGKLSLVPSKPGETVIRVTLSSPGDQGLEAEGC